MGLELSPCQEEIVKLRCNGLLIKEIADVRFVEEDTVKTHFKRALKKNKITSAWELVARYAAANPHIFKTAIAVVFTVIQSFSIATSNDDVRRFKTSRKGHRTHKTARKWKQ